MKNKTLLALILLLAVSTTMTGMEVPGKTQHKPFAYTNDDVWAAYEGFNRTLLDPVKYIYKTNSSDQFVFHLHIRQDHLGFPDTLYKTSTDKQEPQMKHIDHPVKYMHF